MKKLKIFSLLAAIMTALSLTACLPEKKPVSVYEQYSDVSENFGSDVVEGILGKKLGGSREVMNAENSEKLRSALHDIRINNSRIALPLMVCDLPEGFSVIYGDEYKLDGYDYSMFTGVLAFGESELGDVYIARRRGVSEQEGVIIGAMFNSDSCKWSVGEADSCDINVLENAFGKPSGTESIASENSSDHTYIADSGEFALFIPRINCAFVFAINCTQLEENKALCEYVPYDDFVRMTDLPPVSGEKTDFDGGAAFSENGIVIGDFSCPANIAVSRLENTDISLVYYETKAGDGENESGENLVYDSYILLYKGRNIGVCQSVRKEEQPRAEAEMYLWLVSDRAGLPCDVSLAGIPVSESRDSLEKCFNFYSIDPKCDDFELYGLNSTGDKDYFVTYFRRGSGSSVLMIEKF
ncbi:MAG: hypothetical protein SOZ56_01330 [Oscillospiraceae bacterium]|nr:hypothetical protein [Oscillospiraceae bacterium]